MTMMAMITTTVIVKQDQLTHALADQRRSQDDVHGHQRVWGGVANYRVQACQGGERRAEG